MSTYSKKKLIEIYQSAYSHVVRTIEKNIKYDHAHYMADITDVAKFASLIFDDSSSQAAQEMAKRYEELIEVAHYQMMKDLENGKHIYPCICVVEKIDKKISELENSDSDLEKDEEYEKWMSYYSLLSD